MKDRPILFSAPMVRAILEGRKTQTRRVVRGGWVYGKENFGKRRVFILDRDSDLVNDLLLSKARHPNNQPQCPFGYVGDRLWVKETWCRGRVFPIYRASCCDDKPSANTDDWNALYVDKWTSSIHMPRWASRITLEVVDVRVQRLDDIGEDDAKAEGVSVGTWPSAVERAREFKARVRDTTIAKFAALWDSIHGAGSWDANPWVWVIEFKRIEPRP